MELACLFSLRVRFESPESLYNAIGTQTLARSEKLTSVTPSAAEYYVHVQDCARLHVAALLDPSIQNERIFAFAHPFNWTDIVEILRKFRPQNSKIPDPPSNEGRDISVIKPRGRAEQILKSFFGQRGWTSLEGSLGRGIEGLE